MEIVSNGACDVHGAEGAVAEQDVVFMDMIEQTRGGGGVVRGVRAGDEALPAAMDEVMHVGDARWL
ncbi:MAG: hypothetical protein KF712_16075 [Akkermansiaceae bacterium]|nr:hypothetical protein [Akkermansiaceae bacterium]